MDRNAIALLLLAAVACTRTPEASFEDIPFSVLPCPATVTLGNGYYEISGAPIYIDKALDESSRKTADGFARRLEEVSSMKNSRIRTPEGISFLYAPVEPESYSLEVTQDGVTVRAGDVNGVLYAVQTMSQMLPSSFFSDTTSHTRYRLPCVSIKDRPHFKYRGLLIDSGRHFFPASEIKRCIDIMAVYKLNRLHWHLSEDQGWRIEIKSRPRLTEVGSVRRESQVGHWRDSLDHTPYGGFYSQDEIKDIVRYAGERGITVIPEVDLPGHMMSALAAYPELGCTGGPYEVATTWGVKKDVLCAGNEETFKFLADVLTEVLNLFPSEYINIGGDECPKDRWKECPRCQARIKELGIESTDSHTAEQYLQSYVTNRIQAWLAERGRKIIGWEEIMQGELAPGATVMSWLGSSAGIKAAEKGFDAIMSPGEYMYIDRYQSEEWDVEPVSIGGYLPVEKLWSYNPYEGVPEFARDHIIGVQANLWTEFICTPEYLEYMLLPRLAALSEVQWKAPGEKDFGRFCSALDHSRDIMEAMGYTFCKALWGVVGMPPDERPARTPEELEKYLQMRSAPWAVSKEEGRNLFIIR